MTSFAKILASLCLLIPMVAGCGGGESAEMAEAPATEPMAEAADEYMGPNADLVAEFEASGDAFRAAIDGVEGDQWAFQESEDRWSIAGVCEHVVVAEQGLVHGFVAGLIAGEPNAENTGEYAERDMGVLAMIRDRSNPIQTSEALEPTGAIATRDDCVMAFDSTRAITMELLGSADVDLRTYVGTVNPALDTMDVHAWLLFASGHVERHSEQIEQVKAHEGYPAM